MKAFVVKMPVVLCKCIITPTVKEYCPEMAISWLHCKHTPINPCYCQVTA